MHYKTIVLEFLQEQLPTLHEQLRTSRMLLHTVNAYTISVVIVISRLLPRPPHFRPYGFQSRLVHVGCSEAAVKANQAVENGTLQKSQAQAETGRGVVSPVELLTLAHRTFFGFHGGPLSGRTCVPYPSRHHA
jgi:hypothetical protein